MSPEERKIYKSKLKSQRKSKKERDIYNQYSLFTRIMAAVLCLLMVLSVATTLIISLIPR